MSRKTTARRATAAAAAAAVLVPGFALGIAQAGPNSPAISGLSISAVKATTSPTFAITGKNLDNVGKIALVPDGVARDHSSVVELVESQYMLVSPTKIVVELADVADGPDGDSLPDSTVLAAGKYHVFVSEGDDESVDTVKDDFLAVSTPAVDASGLAPASGPAAPGVKLTVTGSGFLGASRVVFLDGNLTEYPVKAFKVLSDTKLEVTTGELPAGNNVLQVTNVAGTVADADGTYSAKMVTAKAAPVLLNELGGDFVTLSGSGLAAAVERGSVKLVHKSALGTLTEYLVPKDDIVPVSNVELVFRAPSADAFDGTVDNTALVKSGEPFEVVVGKADSSGVQDLGNNTVTGYKVLSLMYAPKPAGDLDVPGVAYGNTVQEATIIGRNLKGAKVTVGSTVASVKSISADGTKIIFRVPSNPKKIGTGITNLDSASRDVFVTTKEGVATVGKVFWTDEAAFATAIPGVLVPADYDGATGEIVLKGKGFASLAASDISVDGTALPASTVLTRVGDTQIRFTWAKAAESVTVRNAADKLIGLASDDSSPVARTIATAVYADLATDTLTLTGTNLKDLDADSLVFAGDGSFKVKLVSSSTTEAVYELTAPIGGSYVAPWNTTSVTPVTGVDANGDGDFIDMGDTAPVQGRTRTTVDAPRVDPVVPIS